MKPVLSEIRGSVNVISLNRPEKLNAFNREMALLLQDLLRKAGVDPSVRAVYLTGSGTGFSAGQDLAEVTDPQGPGMEKILLEQFNPIIRLIKSLEKPVIAAVNGVAAGAGANIALACDIVVAAESASFIQAFSKIGLIPDSGGTFYLPRLIGFQKASAYMMLGDKIPAIEAENMGLIYKSFPDINFSEQSFQLAVRLSEMPTRALALTKLALQQSMQNDLEAQLSLEDRLQQEAAGTTDFNEGVKAFVEKRKPVFIGS